METAAMFLAVLGWRLLGWAAKYAAVEVYVRACVHVYAYAWARGNDSGKRATAADWSRHVALLLGNQSINHRLQQQQDQ